MMRDRSIFALDVCGKGEGAADGTNGGIAALAGGASATEFR
ncbi:hypothetical protein [Mangrovicella endophytica]|nr:hypothetical protein [Mangrovicella endophytica]